MIRTYKAFSKIYADTIRVYINCTQTNCAQINPSAKIKKNILGVQKSSELFL